MKKEILKIIFDGLIADYQPMAEIEKFYKKAVESGVLDIENETEEDYRLPKIILYAILLKMANDLMHQSIPAHMFCERYHQ
jgi:hypothetical protein